MFPVGKLLNISLQGVLGIALQIAFHIPRETLSQHFGAPLQVFSQPLFLDKNLVVRRAKRYQNYADDERDDESSAKQSHLTRPPEPTIQWGILNYAKNTGNKRHCSAIPTTDRDESLATA